MPDFTLKEEHLEEEERELLDAVKNSIVSRLFLEFLQQGGPKPHVVLRLVFAHRTPSIGGRRWKGCRLAMDIVGQLEGIFHLTPLSYADASTSAHAAFEFGLKRLDWTVGNYVGTLIAERDLTNFDFVGGFYIPPSRTEYIDGCRDFISQFFILLHRWGVVEWRVLRIDRGTFDGTNLRVEPGRTGFHEVIGYNYRAHGSHLTVVDDLPIARGNFNDVYFQRIVRYQADSLHTYVLPYSPPAPQPRDIEYDMVLATSQAGTSVAAIGEWSEWTWDETWQRDSRTRGNSAQEGGIEWEYR